MNNLKKDYIDACLRAAAPLVGKKVKRLVRDGGSQYTDEMMGLEFEDGTTVWVMCDPEGNGPGHLGIEK
jgi:hypothetical protein